VLIKELLKNYADVNYAEENSGFTPLIMACHLNNEQDAIRVIETLCNHRHTEDQPRLVNVDFQDFAMNTALHHAAITNKFHLCKYLVEVQKAELSLKNNQDKLAVELTSSDDVKAYLDPL